MRRSTAACFVGISCAFSLASSVADADDGVNFFESEIRPLFVAHCVDCHGGTEPEAGLSLESRTGWKESGVVEPGDPEASLLIAAVRYTDDDLKMPPPDAGGKLTDVQIAALESWVKIGAPDPRVAPGEVESVPGPKLRSRIFNLTDADRNYWAFKRIVPPAVPTEIAGKSSRHPIDALLLAPLEEKGLAMSGPATPREQVRRAYFNLWGLPPTPEAVAEFERNPTDTEWKLLIDRLLASPHYGERWGRHWLDIVRYAESNGYERDGEKPNAWRYRDYVIDSFNNDKSYDEFVREQLAGDELAGPAPADASSSNDAKAWRDSILATGFYRLHVWDDEPDSTLVAEYDDLDDIVVTTGAAFLGLTLGCARCHDHKFDPVSQADYYSLLSFFRGIDPYGQHKTGGGGRATGRIERLLASEADINRWNEYQSRRVKELEVRLANISDPKAREAIKAEIMSAREAKPPFDTALAVAEIDPVPVTRILYRGDVNSPREEVSPAFPSVFGLPSPQLLGRSESVSSSGRRRALANWIASPQNPLTARVMANRIWQHHFGVGLVPTPDDFGNSGLPPTNQQLLDYLAAKFVALGWRMKSMHRLIMTSQAYRQSSVADNSQALSADPENTLLWRQNLRRSDAEVIRDTVLAVSGSLNSKRGGPSVFPTLPPEMFGGQDTPEKVWKESPTSEQNRRSVYLVVKRGLKVPLLESFDFANSTSPVGTRPVTTTAPQALMLLNDAFVQAQAEAFSTRVTREVGSQTDAQITRAFQLAVQRDPTPAERKAASELIDDQRKLSVPESHSEPDRAALISLCRSLLNVNEMIYVD